MPKPAPTRTTAHDTIAELPLVALRETVIFPEMIVPLQVGREKSVAALNAAVAEGGPIALVTQRTARPGGHRPIRPSCTRSAPWPRSPRSSSSRTAPSGPSSRARAACGSTASAQTEPVHRAPDRGARRRDPGRASRSRRSCARSRRQIEQYVANGRPGPAGGGRRRPQHHRAGPPGGHGRLQPGHDHRAAPGAARDDRRRRAPQARQQLPRPPGRDPRAQGPDPVRGQVGDGQDPARVHPARAAQGDPARAGRGRPAAGRDQRAAREGRGRPACPRRSRPGRSRRSTG